MERLPRLLAATVIFWIIAMTVVSCVIIITIPAVFRGGQTWPLVVLAVATPIALFCRSQLKRIEGPYRKALGKPNQP